MRAGDCAYTGSMEWPPQVLENETETDDAVDVDEKDGEDDEDEDEHWGQKTEWQPFSKYTSVK